MTKKLYAWTSDAEWSAICVDGESLSKGDILPQLAVFLEFFL